MYSKRAYHAGTVRKEAKGRALKVIEEARENMQESGFLCLFNWCIVLFIFQEGQQPEQFRQRRQSVYAPGLVVTSADGSVVLLGKKILLIFKHDELPKALISFLASFYLLDLDYPTSCLVSLSMMQRIVFGDNKVHPSCQAEVAKYSDEFNSFCNE